MNPGGAVDGVRTGAAGVEVPAGVCCPVVALWRLWCPARGGCPDGRRCRWSAVTCDRVPVPVTEDACIDATTHAGAPPPSGFARLLSLWEWLTSPAPAPGLLASDPDRMPARYCPPPARSLTLARMCRGHAGETRLPLIARHVPKSEVPFRKCLLVDTQSSYSFFYICPQML